VVGRTLGQYEILRPLGAGGMGEVYRARDSKLKRDVAIKLLPEDVAGDPERLARLQREAELLAALNHPNIAAIHNLEEHDGAHFLVLELVEGETLDARLGRGALPVDEALDLCGQIAEALEAAHDAGIIHRDLKPANVIVTAAGRAKVLDFGIAKALAGSARAAAATSKPTALTGTGMILGTAPYISPEQVRGQPVDARTDIWAFGCILYECLSGRRAFERETVADTLATIVERDPDWSALPAGIPRAVQRLLARCLQRDRKRRLRNIGDAWLQINEAQHGPPGQDRRRTYRLVGAGLAALAAGLIAAAVMWAPAPEPPRPMLVVLPFENLGTPEDEYFADGISDEITARLARLGDLGVIARTSAMHYKNSAKSVRDIAGELGVDYILEGTVRWEHLPDGPSRVRVTPQLVRAADATHLWAEVYEEPLPGVFRVQSEIAERVAEAMDLTLLEPERRALRGEPTRDLEAYDYYLRGNEYFLRTYFEADFEIAERMYQLAIERDPDFALAHARLSQTHSQIYWFHFDRSPGRLALAKAAADRALEINPGLPEAHLVLGQYYYQGHLDYDRALAQLEIARQGMPGNPEPLAYIGLARRRQGLLDEAIESLRGAIRLDPRSPFLNLNQGETYGLARNYEEAQRHLDRVISLTPEWPEAYVRLAQVHLAWDGATEKARAVLEEGFRFPVVAAHEGATLQRLVLDVLDRDFQGLLDRLATVPWTVGQDQFQFVPLDLLRARAYTGLGRPELARAHYDFARTLLEREIDERPDDARLYGALGIAYAGLGQREEAIQAGRRGVDLLPIEREAWRGAVRVEELARIYAMVGEYDDAVELLELLLSRPSDLSVALLRLDPVWDPLRDHPGFLRLLQIYS